jgi:hypothetical protein
VPAALFALALIVVGALLRVLGEAHGSGFDGEAPCGAGGSEGGGFEAG